MSIYQKKKSGQRENKILLFFYFAFFRGAEKKFNIGKIFLFYIPFFLYIKKNRNDLDVISREIFFLVNGMVETFHPLNTG